MLAVLTITSPIFALIALGYLTTRRGMFDSGDMATLGRFVVNIGLPALIFSAVTARPLREIFDLSYVVTYATLVLVLAATSYAVLRAAGVPKMRRAVAILGICCPNTGYVGYPITLLAFPEVAGRILALNVIVENFLSLPLCLMLLELSRDREGQRIGQTAWAILKGMLGRPMIQLLLISVAVNLAGLPLPSAVTQFANLLAGTVAALALFFIGGSLAGLPLRGDLALAAAVVIGKLIIAPLLALALIACLPRLGLPPLQPMLASAFVLGMAMPVLGIYAILAQDYAAKGMASISLLVATGLSFFTLSALLLWLHA
jgi:predicted permease